MNERVKRDYGVMYELEAVGTVWALDNNGCIRWFTKEEAEQYVREFDPSRFDVRVSNARIEHCDTKL